jgi:hypothetical protein
MMKFDERNPYFFKSPFFGFHGNCDKVCPTDSDKVKQIQNGGRSHGNQDAKKLSSLQTSQIFAVMFPVTSTYSGTKSESVG